MWSIRDIVLSLFPILKWLPNYKIKEDLSGDIAAGLTLGIMNIPQGLAFAYLASLPPITGLYVALLPVIVYVVMGTSKHLSVGTFAVVSIMVGNVIEKKLNPDIPNTHNNGSLLNSAMAESSGDLSAVNKQKIVISVTLCLVVGMIQVAMGILRLGFLTIFLSESVISGFTTGAAFWVFTSQIKHVLAIYPTYDGPFALIKTYISILRRITEMNIASFIIGILCLAILLFVKRINEKYIDKLKFPIPAELIVVALATGISYGVNMKEKYHIEIVGSVPLGLPPLSVPRRELIPDLLLDGFVISIVAFAFNISLAKLFSQKNGYTIDANQELLAYGIQNIVGGFFSCFVSAASLGRSLIQENIGRTQLCNVISSAIILLVLLQLAPLFGPLPNAVLGAIIIVAIRRLFKNFLLVKKLWKVNKIDAITWVVTWAAVVLLRIDLGLAIGVIFHTMSLVYRVSRPNFTIFGEVDGRGGIYDVTRYEETAELSGVVIACFHSPLCFINAELFQEKLRKWVFLAYNSANETKRKCTYPSLFSEEDTSTEEAEQSNSNAEACLSDASVSENVTHLDYIHSVIIDCSSFSFIDSTAVKTLNQVAQQFELQSLQLYLVNYSHEIYKILKVGNITKKVIILPTIPKALQHAYRRRHEQIATFMNAENGDSKV